MVKKTCLLPLFLAIGLLIWWYRLQSIELFEIPKEMIGIATLGKIDVSARVGLFYRSLLVFGVSLGLFCWIDHKIWAVIQNPRLRDVLGTQSAIGLLLIGISLFTGPQEITLGLLLITMGGALFFYTLKPTKNLSDTLFLKLIVLTLSLGFGAYHFLAILGVNGPLISIQVLFATLLFLFLLLAALFYRSEHHLDRFLTAATPFLFLPGLAFLSDETYLVLNQHDVHVLSPGWFYGLYSLLMLGLSVWIYRRGSIRGKSRLVFQRYGYPLFLLAVVIGVYYQPLYEQTQEMFELANTSNAVMRWQLFNEIPILEAQSSHLLSNYLFPLLYVKINGYYGDLSFLNYHFLHWVIIFLSAYFFLKGVLKDRTAPFLLLLIFPLAAAVIGTWALALMIPVFYVALYRNYSFIKLVLFLIFGAFTLFFRPDIGVSALVGSVFIIFIHHVVYGNKSTLKNLALGLLLVVFGISVPVLLTAYSRNIDLYAVIHQSLDYFGGSQAHGYLKIVNEPDRFALFHYIVFPLLSLVALMYFSVRYYQKQTHDPNQVLFILFVAAFYLMHSQRGLVRHGLIEGYDSFISGYFYLLAGLVVVYFYKGLRPVFVFSLVTSLLLINFRYPDVKGNDNLLEQFIVQAQGDVPITSTDQKIDRVKPLNLKDQKKLYGDLKQFLDENLEKNQTFFDFSNTPMLYFYTQRAVPSYFNQSLQNVVTGYLQEENIKRISGMDIPLVIFAHEPPNWYDRTDGVNNALRYHRLTEYIYRSYEPLGQVGDYYLWVKKGVEIKNKALLKPNTDVALRKVEQKLKKLPVLLADSLNDEGFETVYSIDHPKTYKGLYSFQAHTSKTNNYTGIDLTISNPDTSVINCHLRYKDGPILRFDLSFELLPNSIQQKYRIPLQWMYVWHAQSGQTFYLLTTPKKPFSLEKITFIKPRYEN